jgi:hypothetical protein
MERTVSDIIIIKDFRTGLASVYGETVCGKNFLIQINGLLNVIKVPNDLIDELVADYHELNKDIIVEVR